MKPSEKAAPVGAVFPKQTERPTKPSLPGVPTDHLIERLDVSVYRIPTTLPEADGTINWDATTMVLVEVTTRSGHHGLGYSYASAVAAPLIRDTLAPVVIGCPIEDIRAIWGAMIRTVRNLGLPGIAATAISAVDVALWDLKARLAGQALFLHLGAHRGSVTIYGSGGFTTYTDEQMARQFTEWLKQGISQVKMKIGAAWGSEPKEDLRRVEVARRIIGPSAELFVDANGGYRVKEAMDLGERFIDDGVTWFEEPVSSDQLRQLSFVRSHLPMRIAAGEYGYTPWYFREMLEAGAVDVLQADATRCLGITGFLEAGALAHGFAIPFSAHTAPSIHAQVGCVVPELLNVEYFFDHARIEHLLFDGVLDPVKGCLIPDPQRPGLGLALKRQDAERWRIAA